MGVDINTYRCRIGRFNRVNGSTLLPKLFLHPNLLVKALSLVTKGAVLCILLLLFIAGVELNPGPKSKDNDETAACIKPEDKQKGKSIKSKFKNFFGIKTDQSQDKSHVRPKSLGQLSKDQDVEKSGSDRRRNTFGFMNSATTEKQTADEKPRESVSSDITKDETKPKKVKLRKRPAKTKSEESLDVLAEKNVAKSKDDMSPDDLQLTTSTACIADEKILKGFPERPDLNKEMNNTALCTPGKVHQYLGSPEAAGQLDLEKMLSEGRGEHSGERKNVTIQVIHAKYSLSGEGNKMVVEADPDKMTNNHQTDLPIPDSASPEEMLNQSLLAWIEDNNFFENCSTYLLNLIVEVESSLSSRELWQSMLVKNTALDCFMAKIYLNRMKLETSFPVVRYYLERLIPTNISLLSQNVKNVNSWICLTKTRYQLASAVTFEKIISVKHFVDHLNAFITDLEIQNIAKHRTEETLNSDMDTYITSEVAVAVHRLCILLEQSKKENEIHDHCFLRILLIPLTYSHKGQRFQIRVTYEKLHDFIKNAERELEKYETYQKISVLYLQAYLFELLIEFIKTEDNDYMKDDHMKEDVFKECINPISHCLLKPINDALSRYATDHPFEFEKLLLRSKKVLAGDTNFENDQNPSLETFQNILQPNLIDFQTSEVVSKAHFTMSKQGQNILCYFRLTDYFPAQISIQNVQERLIPNNSNSCVDIPWIILRKLLQVDFRARDKTPDEFFASYPLHNLEQFDEDDRDFEEFMDDFLTSDHRELSTNDTQTKIFHPTDILLTIFCCCDFTLKQILVERLYLCRLAIPFIYPCLSSETLYCSFWSMRSINIELKDLEFSVITDPIKRVGFIRIDRPPYSKSKLINTMLSDSAHDTFCHKDSSNTLTPKLISDGLVEAFWLLPQEQISEMMMILNLRGDALNNRRQVKVLTDIVNVLVVVVDVDNLSDSASKEILDSLYSSSSAIVLIVTNQNPQDNHENILKDYLKLLKSHNRSNRTGFISTLRNGDLKTEVEMKTSVSSKICKFLTTKSASTLDQCRLIMTSFQIVDEETDCNCTRAYQNAVRVVPEDISPVDTRDAMLPLQHETLWGEWNKLSCKELESGEKLSYSDKDKIHCEMKELRRQQVRLCKNLSPNMIFFLKTITEVFDKSEKVLFFCKWLKFILDKHSRKILPILIHEFRSNRSTSSHIHQMPNDTNFVSRDRARRVEINFDKAIFTTEHLFREVAQIYEAIMDTNQDIKHETKQLVENLPRAVAKLIQLGHPFELMDGDNTTIPLLWIKAVFRHLHMSLKEKKLLSVSVIGAQGSGKSTLLNTMFGLSFPVSAGRCTRGLFAKLLPSYKTICQRYDYVLVIDTEGMRSVGDAIDSRKKDNILATLGVGLADITLVNVIGETVDVKEILQIVVHAFLRLKRANSQLTLNKSCVFLQQNVPSPNAENKMFSERENFESQLDELTKEAAYEEGEKITNFKQVIEFDSERHFWYFPGFWNGTPPIAPVNPVYSDKVNSVKICIFDEIASKLKNYFTFEKFGNHIEDLWIGMLSDNFVYSFRTSLEIRAYKSMIKKSQDLLYELEEFMYERRRNVSIVIDDEYSNDIDDEHFKKYEEDVNEFCQTQKQKLDQSIKDDELRDIQLKWRDQNLEMFDRIKHFGIAAARKSLRQAKEEKIINIDKKKDQFQITLIREAHLLAEEMKQITTNEDELNKKFDEMWIHWINQHRPQTPSGSNSIENIIIEKLYEHFQSSRPLLNNELERLPLSEPLRIARLENSVDSEKFRPYLQRHAEHVKQSLERDEVLVAKITNCIFNKLDSFLDDIFKREAKFNKTYVTKILRIITEELANKSSLLNQRVLMHTEYTIFVSVYSCRYARQIFSTINDRYENKHGIDSHITDCRDRIYKFFTRVFQARQKNVLASEMFCDILIPLIETTLEEKIQNVIENKVMLSFSYSKQNLIACMMTSLLDRQESNFDSFQKFFDDPEALAFETVKHFIESEFFKVHREQRRTKYAFLTQEHTNNIIRSLHNIINNVTRDTKSKYPRVQITSWIQEFVKQCDLIPITTSLFGEVIVQGVTQLESFQELVCRRLDLIKKSILDTYDKTYDRKFDWHKQTMHHNVMEKLWGCTKKCPFCHEPCDNNDKDHIFKNILHSCALHRPPIVREITVSTKDNKTHAFNVCNQLVNSDLTFKCADCDYECRQSGECKEVGSKSVTHRYKDYKIFFPNWNIVRSKEASVSTYWKWFLKTYSYQLKRRLNTGLPKIPDAWKRIQCKDASGSIQQNEAILKITSV